MGRDIIGRGDGLPASIDAASRQCQEARLLPLVEILPLELIVTAPTALEPVNAGARALPKRRDVGRSDVIGEPTISKSRICHFASVVMMPERPGIDIQRADVALLLVNSTPVTPEAGGDIWS